MNKEDQYVKPIMQVILGVGLFAIYILTEAPIRMVFDNRNTNWYNPVDELFLISLKWISLFGSIGLTLLGLIHLIKLLLRK